MDAIDLHAHYMPQRFLRLASSGEEWHGIRLEHDDRSRRFGVAGPYRFPVRPRDSWSVAQRLLEMDAMEIGMQVVSGAPQLYNYHLPGDVALATCRDTNDEIAEMVGCYPDRFKGIAILPMQDVSAAIAEMERTIASLGFSGVMIGDHVNERGYDEVEFEAFFKEAERLGALVLFHQGCETLISPHISRYRLPDTLGGPSERSLTYGTLVSSGLMDRVPDLKVCLAHGGGHIAYGIGRMDRAWEFRPEARVSLHDAPGRYLRRFYFDCLTHSERALRLLLDTVGIDRVVLGSCWPSDLGMEWPVAWVKSLETLSHEEKHHILTRNAADLLGIS